MLFTTTYSAGQVVVVNVPFTGQGGAKARPALIVSVSPFHGKIADVVIVPISSQPRYYKTPGVGDLPLKQWQAAGLRHPSTARISNILAAEKSLIKRVLGTLGQEDYERVKDGLRKTFGL